MAIFIIATLFNLVCIAYLDKNYPNPERFSWQFFAFYTAMGVVTWCLATIIVSIMSHIF
jgi:hypothetical protein